MKFKNGDLVKCSDPGQLYEVLAEKDGVLVIFPVGLSSSLYRYTIWHESVVRHVSSSVEPTNRSRVDAGPRTL